MAVWAGADIDVAICGQRWRSCGQGWWWCYRPHGHLCLWLVLALGWWRWYWNGQNEPRWLVPVEYGSGRHALVGLSLFSFKIHRINTFTLPSTIAPSLLPTLNRMHPQSILCPNGSLRSSRVQFGVLSKDAFVRGTRLIPLLWHLGRCWRWHGRSGLVC
jgi:hypothetical protein